ncbi:MAG: radical SAM-associated putative lipoprotein [Bacteroidales bacterium]|nr:radical SAM-associated putative lipoprotein [Bacteroidales bacterium]
MKIRYFKLKNWIILSLMSALGLNACHNTKDVAKDGHRDKKPRPRQEIMLLYGVPPVDYIEHLPDSVEGEDATPKDKGVAEETKPQVRQEQPLMYGVPTVDFQLKGKVVDQQGKPVRGAQVILLNSEIDSENLDAANPEYMKQYIKRSGDTTATDGSFKVSTFDRPWDKQKLLVRDVDGEENGVFNNQIIDVEFPEGQGMKPRTKEIDVTVTRKK